MNTSPTAPTPAPPTPLSAVLLFTFLNSVGTAVVTNGIFFLTRFSKFENYALAMLLGVTYIIASLGAHPFLNWLGRRHDHFSARSVLAWMMIVLALLCTLPLAAARLAPEHRGASIWVLVGLYSPLTGVLWPLVESYLSGGRGGGSLRSATGVWNVVWSAAGVLAYWSVSRVVKSSPSETLAVLGGVHAAAALVLLRFEKEPGEHAPEYHEPHPPVYRTLLHTFRVLLPATYIVLATLSPYLPSAMEELGVGADWYMPIASCWMLSRVIGFAVFHRWAGWHGRWWPAILGGILVLVGFGTCVMSPWISHRVPGIAGLGSMIGGLALFGLGLSVTYSAAIYYALEVGQSEVQAGGKHEALIGVGYTFGPFVGLAASQAERAGWIRQESFNPLVLGAVGLVGVAAAAIVVVRMLRHARPPGTIVTGR